MRLTSVIVAAVAASVASVAAAAPDPKVINQILDQGYAQSEVMNTASHLTDRIGGRLTNSPAMREAETWTQDQFRRWGLFNVRTEGFEFGPGWWIESASVRMTTPRPLALRSIPIAWTPPTAGAVSGEVVVAPMTKEAHFDDWRGKLAGKIVLVTFPRPDADETEVPFKRFSNAEIARFDEVAQPLSDIELERQTYTRIKFEIERDRFLKKEGALAWVRMSARDNGLLHGNRPGPTRFSSQVPAVELAAEDYRRLTRLAKSGPVTLEINSNVHFTKGDTKAYNVFADIPGADDKAGYVMAGAHLDSWVAGDGATDNAAGVSVVMEAARILKAIGVKPLRTIRFALWSGEEQGLLGSAAYVRAHLATRPDNPDPAKAALGPAFNRTAFPITKGSDYDRMAGYFNIDNGSGKVRGLYAEGNFAAVPMLKDWLSPFAGLEATAVVARSVFQTDHAYLQHIGLPAFQFVQDPLDYDSRTHHTHIDTYDHLRPADMRQAAVVLASVLLSAANSPTPLSPRTLPTKQVDPETFRYQQPDEN